MISTSASAIKEEEGAEEENEFKPSTPTSGRQGQDRLSSSFEQYHQTNHSIINNISSKGMEAVSAAQKEERRQQPPLGGDTYQFHKQQIQPLQHHVSETANQSIHAQTALQQQILQVDLRASGGLPPTSKLPPVHGPRNDEDHYRR